MPNIISENAKRSFDAIVIGSGVSGGWAAKELTEKGLKVLMLERGKPLDHIAGYETAGKAPWEFEHRNTLSIRQAADYPFQIRDYPYGEDNLNYWFKDSEAPYSESQRFDWFRPDIMGGKSIMWGRQSYRWSDTDFEANAKDGIAIDWPIRYADLKPWYDYVEKHIGISGENLGLSHFPDQELMPPMPLMPVEKHLKKSIETKHAGRHLTIGRVANITQPLPGRSACQYRNLCPRGCPFSAYFSTQSSTLPYAQETKRLTVRTNAMVSSIVYDSKKGKAKGVKVIDTQTGEMMEYKAKIIFVCASAVSSTWILMNSRSAQFPDGLGNESGVLGKYLMDHHFRTGANGKIDGFEDFYYYGRRPNGIYVPRFQNVGKDKRDYLRGFGYQGGASREGWKRVTDSDDFGAAMKQMASEPGDWRLGMGGFGECLPYEDNTMSLNMDKKDKWGQPTIHFNASFKENERKMRLDMANEAAAMLEEAGFKDVRTYDSGSYPGMAIHEMGTARMGHSVKDSILNKWNQVHSCKNVFVTDGACMTSNACVNPSLTYMALTARAADYAVQELKRKNL